MPSQFRIRLRLGLVSRKARAAKLVEFLNVAILPNLKLSSIPNSMWVYFLMDSDTTQNANSNKIRFQVGGQENPMLQNLAPVYCKAEGLCQLASRTRHSFLCCFKSKHSN